MRIERLAVAGYGRLRDWERELGPVAVLLGDNEHGKSTVRDLVITLLYGFEPSNREQHPYVPWGETSIEFEARLALSDGRAIVVRRRLLSRPQGALEETGASGAGSREELRNQPLSAVGRVGRELYRAAFAIAPADLRIFEKDAWAALEGELLGEGEASGFRRAAEVAAQLKRDADALWRGDRRGTPRAAALERRAGELDRQVREARENDARLHDARQELEDIERKRASLRERRRELLARRERLSRLQETANALAELDRLREAAGDPALLRGLPADPPAEYRRLLGEVQKEARHLEESLRPRLEAARGAATVPAEDLALLERAREIEQVVSRAAQLSEYRDRAGRARDRLQAARRAAEDEARAVLAADAVPGLTLERMGEALDRIERVELEQRAEAFAEAAEAEHRQEEALRAHRVAMAQVAAERERHAPRPSPAVLRRGPAAVLGAMGLLVLAAGVAVAAQAGSGWGIAVAVLGAAIAATAALAAAGSRPAAGVPAGADAAGAEGRTGVADPEEAVLAEQLDAARREAAERAAAVRKRVAALPLVPALLERPDRRLAEAVERLRRAVADWRAAAAEAEERSLDVRRVEEEVLGLARSLAASGAAAGGTSSGAPGVEAGAASSGAPGAARSVAAAAGPDTAPDAIPEGEADLLAARLRDRLEEARQAREAANVAGERAQTLQEEVRQAEERLRDAEAELAALRESLAPFAEDPLEACEEAKRRLQARDRAQDLEERMERGAAGQSLDSLRAAVAAAAEAGELPFSDADRIDDDVAAIDERLEDAARREGELRNEVRRLESLPRADDLAGERDACRAEAREAARERDRLALLAEIVRRAEERFREAHRPDVLRRAGEHLRAFTGGRYDQLDFVDPPEDDAERRRFEEALPEGGRNASAMLAVAGPAARGSRDAYASEWMPVARPLSQGTLHQIHFALRAALADHLDEGQEPLPVCLDETFAHWDAKRRRACLSWLGEWSRRRQVLLFTCHEPLAREAEELAGGTVVPV